MIEMGEYFSQTCYYLGYYLFYSLHGTWSVDQSFPYIQYSYDARTVQYICTLHMMQCNLELKYVCVTVYISFQSCTKKMKLIRKHNWQTCTVHHTCGPQKSQLRSFRWFFRGWTFFWHSLNFTKTRATMMARNCGETVPLRLPKKALPRPYNLAVGIVLYQQMSDWHFQGFIDLCTVVCIGLQ